MATKTVTMFIWATVVRRWHHQLQQLAIVLMVVPRCNMLVTAACADCAVSKVDVREKRP